jgi:hypothetical protein
MRCVEDIKKGKEAKETHMCYRQLLLIFYLSLEEDERRLWIIWLHYDHFRLDVTRKVLLGINAYVTLEKEESMEL